MTMETDFSPPDMEYVEGAAEEQDISPELVGDETISLADILSSTIVFPEPSVAAVSEVLVIHKVWNISREHFTTSNARQHF
jgi:hypothetical protein